MVGNSSCKICPVSYYCGSGTSFPTLCQMGYYCPLATQLFNEYPCPNGTFSNSTGLSSVSQCTPCTPGEYCGSPGLIAPTGPCDAGYFCGGGSSVATPQESAKASIVSYTGGSCVVAVNGTRNDVCPPGHYCPTGSPSPVQCPPGTNSSSYGLTSVSSCPPCTAGYYCPLNGTVYASDFCWPGYYCMNGTSVPNLLCPPGFYCPSSSFSPLPCGPGSFQSSSGESTCKSCIEGYYCPPRSSTPIICPPRYYCPSNSTIPLFCPDGSFSNSSGLASVFDCTPCPPRVYCSQGKIQDYCAAGFFCKLNQSIPNPEVNLSSYTSELAELQYLNKLNGGPCPPGKHRLPFYTNKFLRPLLSTRHI